MKTLRNGVISALICLIFSGCGAGSILGFGRYSTPEKTWETYREAVFRGDMEAALDCFAEYMRDRAKRRYDEVGAKGIQQRIGPVKRFELIGDATIDNPWLHLATEYKEYRIIMEEDRADGIIFFVRINGNWKIEQLPGVMDLEGF